MNSEIIYELLKPGDVFLLYKEHGSFLYAVNKDGGLSIERAFVPPDTVRRSTTGGALLNHKEAEGVANRIVKDLTDKCKDCKKESDVWPGNLDLGFFRHCTP